MPANAPQLLVNAATKLGSALLGATLLSIADLIARVLLRPAELPIGIVTAVVGVPVFLSLLRSKEYLS